MLGGTGVVMKRLIFDVPPFALESIPLSFDLPLSHLEISSISLVQFDKFLWSSCTCFVHCSSHSIMTDTVMKVGSRLCQYY